VTDQSDDDVVDFTAERSIPYLPWLPLRPGNPSVTTRLQSWAVKLDASAAQVALAWLLQRAPNILPIPGTSSAAHLAENVAARNLRLPDAAMRELTSRPAL
jgi:pyridoxine 4-dehydrogenase